MLISLRTVGLTSPRTAAGLREPRTAALISPQMAGLTSPQTVDLREPRTAALISPQTACLTSPQMADLRKPQTTAGLREARIAAGWFWLGAGHSPDTGGSLPSILVRCLGGPRGDGSWPRARTARGSSVFAFKKQDAGNEMGNNYKI